MVTPNPEQCRRNWEEAGQDVRKMTGEASRRRRYNRTRGNLGRGVLRRNEFEQYRSAVLKESNVRFADGHAGGGTAASRLGSAEHRIYVEAMHDFVRLARELKRARLPQPHGLEDAALEDPKEFRRLKDVVEQQLAKQAPQAQPQPQAQPAWARSLVTCSDASEARARAEDFF